jgi:hypothetical protein
VAGLWTRESFLSGLGVGGKLMIQRAGISFSHPS